MWGYFILEIENSFFKDRWMADGGQIYRFKTGKILFF